MFQILSTTFEDRSDLINAENSTFTAIPCYRFYGTIHGLL